MFRIALIDDDNTHREYFENQIAKFFKDKPYTLNVYSSPKEFQSKQENLNELDLLLLDIHYKEENGIDFIKKFQKDYPFVDIIFMSSYLEFAPKTYDVNHISFIYKRDIGYHLKDAFEKAVKNKEERDHRILKLRWKNTFFLVPIKDIVYIEKVLRKTNVHTKDRVYTSYMKMDEILDHLDDNFLRVHFSYVVNKDYIHEFHSDNLIMTNNEYIPVSRTYSKQVMNYISNLFEKK